MIFDHGEQRSTVNYRLPALILDFDAMFVLQIPNNIFRRRVPG